MFPSKLLLLIISFLFLFIFISPNVWASDAEEQVSSKSIERVLNQKRLEDDVGDCKNPQTQIEMSSCGRRAALEADKALNNAYNKKMKSLKEKVNQDNLKSSQLAWINYRDKTCIYEAGSEAFRASVVLVVEHCLTRVIKARTEEINAFLKCTDNGCPQ